jgi:hypothetical protein
MLLSFEGELDFKEDQEERSTMKENVNHFQEEDDAITLGGYRMLTLNSSTCIKRPWMSYAISLPKK